jgi:DNA-binding XRE family transcriptional regulator
MSYLIKRLAWCFYLALSAILRLNRDHVLRIQFGKRLRELRKQNNLSQEKFAEAVGVSTFTIYRWETALDAPEFDRLEQIADALGVPVKELFDFHDTTS